MKKPGYVSKDKIANRIWNELVKEFKSAADQGVELLTSSDVGTLALYCKTFSEYERLLVQYQRIENIDVDEHILAEFIGRGKALDEVNYNALRYLSQLASIEGILKIETAINKKMDMLLKMQDRLFTKSTPKEEGYE